MTRHIAGDVTYARLLAAAVTTYQERQARRVEPDGARSSHNEHCWYPAPTERRPCCRRIPVTATSEQALLQHCRSLTHVAQLFRVAEKDLRAARRATR